MRARPHGFAYVPASCAAGQSCRLLVALHGCAQGYARVGTAFVDRANLGATNYPIKGGAQVEAIMNMVRRLGG
ncbi:hypothetical protein AB0H57_29930 [Micromonospora sp. NPDC050686]|uniref:hypothetical protein n=1 Tax=Micromonospora sp. NPDC050686 TaxID=3154631 RepID=UPI0034114B4C